MSVYFAYGSNLDRRAMGLRCPEAAPLGVGTLANHRFFIMASGYASVRPERAAAVHGLLWRLVDRDIAALDVYEEVDRGLYRKATVTIVRPDGSSADALIYIGESQEIGQATTAYMGAVIAAAAGLGLAASYRKELLGWMP